MLNHETLETLLQKRFQITTHNSGPYTYWRFDLNLEQTPIYNGLMPIPKVPIFHPYNPTGANENQQEGTHGIVGSIIAAHLGTEILPFLPESIKQIIDLHKIPKEKIECSFASQNMPWKKEVLLLRPHYGLHADKKLYDELAKTAKLTVTTDCRIGIFAATTANITIDGKKDVLSQTFLKFSSHPGADESKQTPMTIVSPDKIGVMAGIDFNRTDSLYSVVLTSDNRLLVTLHWLLNPQDQALLTASSYHVKNLAELIATVQTFQSSRLSEKNGPLHHLQQILNVKTKEELEIIQQQELLKKLEQQRMQDIKQQRELLDKFAAQKNAKELKNENKPLNPATQENGQDVKLQAALLRQFEKKTKLDQNHTQQNILGNSPPSIEEMLQNLGENRKKLQKMITEMIEIIEKNKKHVNIEAFAAPFFEKAFSLESTYNQIVAISTEANKKLTDSKDYLDLIASFQNGIETIKSCLETLKTLDEALNPKFIHALTNNKPT